MVLKGIQKTSLVDYPGKISAVFFFGGCNFFCPYCHNPDLLQINSTADSVTVKDALAFLDKRASLIDGVVISGGEPTLSKGLDKFIKEIKKYSLSVKLDSNGSHPEVISDLLMKNLIDYFAVDVKTSPLKYSFFTDITFTYINRTIDIIKESGSEYEIRTTCVPGLVNFEDFSLIGNKIGHVKRYYLQQFVNRITLDPALQKSPPYSVSELYKFKNEVSNFSDICEVRGI